MKYKLGKYLAHTDEFEFIFDDRRWIAIDLVNDYPNYIYKEKDQTKYDKECYKENPYSDNYKLYILLFNLFNKNIKITLF
jgi:hypothetical protein